MSKNNETVIVAMSGGVDSSVAAALLLEQGYRVVGVTMLLWDGEAHGIESGCCGTQDLSDARAVCSHLGINHYSMDLRQEFMDDVVEPFIRTYLTGQTPNPCILCNEHLKFRYLLNKALAVGAGKLATGHYARVIGNGSRRLARGLDSSKDQSYFLYPVDQSVLGHLLLPLGELSKEEVRQRAGDLGLKVHEKPDSQEICFIPPGGLKEFIRDSGEAHIRPGPVLDMEGNSLGTHDGVCYYTVGQRKGLGIANREPLYVVKIDAETNTVVLGPRNEATSRELTVDRARWIAGESPPALFRASVQIRHRHTPAPCLVQIGKEGSMKAVFDEPQHGVAPGQAAVVYDGDYVLGGGWISEAQ
ncbi:tRNA 2-thiouridine(34) synthase MnmA [bacterium]|nr:MAG: tRNA 2-thiouridine(34) synthase MnmA [bacterium]